MANNLTINESATWPSSVHLIDTDEKVLGGVSGPANQAAIALANRSQWLKAEIDAVVTEAGLTQDVNVATKLKDAILALIQAGQGTGNPGANNFRLATVAETIQGTSTATAAPPAGVDGAITSKTVRTRYNISGLRAVTGNWPVVYVEGYRSAGDGGGGIFWLDSSDTVTDDDGGNVFVTTNGARYKRFALGDVSVRHFGAMGNGVANETDEFQAAAAAAAGAPVYVPAGTYVLADYVPVGPFYGPGVAKIVVESGPAHTFTFPSTPFGWKAPVGLGEIIGRMAGQKTIRIACFGDSTTDGAMTSGWTMNDATDVTGKPWTREPVGGNNHDLQAPNAYPMKLQNILRYYYGNTVSVWNCGYSGQRMTNGWAWTFFERAILNNPYRGVPDVCIIQFGLNDQPYTGSFVNEFIAETERVVQKCIGYGILPVLMTCDAIWQSTNEHLLPITAPDRENSETARQMDAASMGLAHRYGIPVIDMGRAIQTWLTQNDDGDSFGSVEVDALHLGDKGHRFKAEFLARNFMRDIYVSNGSTVERIHWQDSRANYSGGEDNYYYPPAASNQYGNANDSRFPWFWRLRINDDGSTGYDPLQKVLEAWVWVENKQPALIYRNIGNGGIGSAVAEANFPAIQVGSAGEYPVNYVNVPTPNAGGDEWPFTTDRPYYVRHLRYGLNIIRIIAPGVNTIDFFGGWFEVNPFWREKTQFDWIRNRLDPSYGWQSNCLKGVGPFEFGSIAPANWGNQAAADGTNPVAFAFPEEADGSNVADFGWNATTVDVLCEAIIPQGTGILLFSGKSVTTSYNDPDDLHQDRSILIQSERTQDDSLSLYHLYAPSYGNPSYELLATGTAGMFTAGVQKKFMVRFSRKDLVQTITLYNGWTILDSVVCSWTGTRSGRQVPGAGVMGGVFLRRAPGTNRTVRINTLLVRKFK